MRLSDRKGRCHLAKNAPTHTTKVQCTTSLEETERRRTFLEKLKHSPWKLRDSIYTDDKELVVAAVAESGYVLDYASEDLKADKEVVLAAVTSEDSDGALQYASGILRADKDVVLAAAANEGSALRFASADLQGDKEVALVAVTHNGCALEYASKTLQADKDVVLAAVTNSGHEVWSPLRHASETLRADKDVVLAAVTNHGSVLELASNDLRADKEVVLAAVTNYGSALEWASVALQDDKEVVLAAAVAGSFEEKLLEYASIALQADKDVVLAAVTNNGEDLAYASEALQADKDVVLAAVAAIRFADYVLQHVSSELLDCSIVGNMVFVETVMQAYRNGFPLHYVRYLPELRNVLLSLHQKLEASGNFQPENCGDVSPDVFAEQCLACLWQPRWCLDQACKDGSIPADTQRHICEFSGLLDDIQTANLLQTYSPILSVLVDMGGGDSWWGLLEEANGMGAGCFERNYGYDYDDDEESDDYYANIRQRTAASDSDSDEMVLDTEGDDDDASVVSKRKQQQKSSRILDDDDRD